MSRIYLLYALSLAFAAFFAVSCGKHPYQSPEVRDCEITLAAGQTCKALVDRGLGPAAAACSDDQEHLYPINAKLNCLRNGQ